MAAIAAALVLGACGTEGIEVADDDPNYDGAVLFSERCSGCHTMDVVGAQGSANRTLRNQGPNLDASGNLGAKISVSQFIEPTTICLTKFIMSYSSIYLNNNCDQYR